MECLLGGLGTCSRVIKRRKMLLSAISTRYFFKKNHSPLNVKLQQQYFVNLIHISRPYYSKHVSLMWPCFEVTLVSGTFQNKLYVTKYILYGVTYTVSNRAI